MNAILKAQQRAVEIIQAHSSDAAIEAERLRLKGMTKDQLIELILAGKRKTRGNVEAVSYAIQCDADCAWLTYEAIASLINTHMPGTSTNANCQRWYFSKQTERGHDCVPRKSMKTILAALAG